MKQEANKKQNEKCYECGQVGHYINECPSKKKKEGRGERRRFNNFQITWNDCNSDGEVEEEEETAQMAFMAIGNDEVTSSCSSMNKNECDDDDLEDFVVKLHDSLRDSYAKNKELKLKINALLSENARLVQDSKDLRKENDELKKNKVDMSWNLEDLKNKLEERTSFYERIKNEQNDLKNRMNILSEFLRQEKQDTLNKDIARNMIGSNRSIMYRNNGVRIIKSMLVSNPHIMCNFCCQVGHLKNNCYVRRNMRHGMKAMWVIKHCTNSCGPNEERVPNVIS